MRAEAGPHAALSPVVATVDATGSVTASGGGESKELPFADVAPAAGVVVAEEQAPAAAAEGLSDTRAPSLADAVPAIGAVEGREAAVAVAAAEVGRGAGRGQAVAPPGLAQGSEATYSAAGGGASDEEISHVAAATAPGAMAGHLQLGMADAGAEAVAAAADVAGSVAKGSLCLSFRVGCYHDVLEQWEMEGGLAQQKGVCQQQQVEEGCSLCQQEGLCQQQPGCKQHEEKSGVQYWSEVQWQQVLRHPHVVFAPNAGLPVYPSWMPTLQRLFPPASGMGVGAGATSHNGHPVKQLHHGLGGVVKSLQKARESGSSVCGSADGVSLVEPVLPVCASQKSTQVFELCPNAGPAPRSAVEDAAAACGSGGALKYSPPLVCTDYCEEAAVKSCEMIEAVFAMPPSIGLVLNPFRSVVPSCGGGTMLPSCSNAVLFGWYC